MGISVVPYLSVGCDFTFEAAHVLPEHPGKCSSVHGHSWKLTVMVSGLVDSETGFVVDYANLKALVKQYIIDVCDHAWLGCGNMLLGPIEKPVYSVFGEEFYPSSENIVAKIVDILQPRVPELGKPQQHIRLSEVTIHETCTSTCTWRS